jgi:hypothetical protein
MVGHHVFTAGYPPLFAAEIGHLKALLLRRTSLIVR